MEMTSKSKVFDNDGYLHHAFPFHDKVRRFLFSLTWFLLCRWTPRPFHRWRAFVLKVFGARLGKRNAIYPDCIIWAPWLLETSDVVTIGPGVEVYNPGGVRLGHHTILSQGAYICGATHDYDSKDFVYVKKEIAMESYVWICARAIVLPGVKCCEGSVLAAGSVAAKTLEPWTVYRGNPAVPVKSRINFTV